MSNTEQNAGTIILINQGLRYSLKRLHINSVF